MIDSLSGLQSQNELCQTYIKEIENSLFVAVAHEADGGKVLTVFEERASCSVTLSPSMADKIARLLME